MIFFFIYSNYLQSQYICDFKPLYKDKCICTNQKTKTRMTIIQDRFTQKEVTFIKEF